MMLMTLRVEMGFGVTVSGLAPCSSAPQSPQNFLLAGLSAPHCGHRSSSAAPQSPQNFLPAGLSDWHAEQRIRSTYRGETPRVTRTAASASRGFTLKVKQAG